MTEYRQFFNSLVTILNRYDGTYIKESIGDSTNNHRVPTVNQVIRFLSSSRKAELRTLGDNLSLAYETLKEEIETTRRSNTSRSDAIDINEFIDTYNEVVISSGDIDIRRTLGENLITA